MKKQLIPLLSLLSSLGSVSASASGLSPFIDLLEWQVSEQPASIWASKFSFPESNAFEYSFPNIDFHWNLGFRGGFLYEPECGFWDTRLYWTYFSAKTTSDIPIGPQIVTSQFFSGYISQNVFFGSHIYWHFVMNMVDLNASHAFTVADRLTLRPSIGIKGGTIHQRINSQWDAVIYTANESVKHHFYGVGPSFGFDSAWHVWNHVSLIGDFSTALMWGHWKVKDTYSRPSTLFGLITTPTTITTPLHHSLMTAMFSYFLGFEWDYQCKSSLNLRLGYEMQYWANQLRLPTFQQLPVHGDLTLQGATCRIQIDL